MELLGTGLIALVIITLVVYYIRKGINAERDNQALEAQSSVQKAALQREEAILAEREREDRDREKASIPGITRERANELLREALDDDFN